LLDIKMNAPEFKLIPRIDAINRYLDENIESLELELAKLSKGASRFPLYTTIWKGADGNEGCAYLRMHESQKVS